MVVVVEDFRGLVRSSLLVTMSGAGEEEGESWVFWLGDMVVMMLVEGEDEGGCPVG